MGRHLNSVFLNLYKIDAAYRAISEYVENTNFQARDPTLNNGNTECIQKSIDRRLA